MLHLCVSLSRVVELLANDFEQREREGKEKSQKFHTKSIASSLPPLSLSLSFHSSSRERDSVTRHCYTHLKRLCCLKRAAGQGRPVAQPHTRMLCFFFLGAAENESFSSTVRQQPRPYHTAQRPRPSALGEARVRGKDKGQTAGPLPALPSLTPPSLFSRSPSALCPHM